MNIQTFLLLITLPFCISIAVMLPLWHIDRYRVKFALGASLLGGFAMLSGGVIFWNTPMDTGKELWAAWIQVPSFPALTITTYVDHLAAAALILIGFFSILVTTFSFNYLRITKNVVSIIVAYDLFNLGMVYTVVSNSVLALILALEIMSLPFAVLVLYRHNKQRDSGDDWSVEERRERKLAFYVYLGFGHIGLLCLTIGLIAHGIAVDSFDFDRWRTASHFVENWTLFLILLGLGTRAGIAPLNIWIPLAHPSSPTNTHAFSLGVAVKIPIILSIRFLLEIFDSPPAWAGMLIMLSGAITAWVGVYMALISHNLKQGLSSHTTENIGIITASLGLAVLLASPHFADNTVLRSWAGVAFLGACLHLVFHAVFKGDLYLSTGAIETLTGQVEYSHLGGILSKFPWTGGAFLVGSLSITGAPLFTGFVSKLVILTAFVGTLIELVGSGQWLVIAALLVTITLLARAFGATVMAFGKIAGVVLFGEPRDKALYETYKNSPDVPWSMRVPMLVLSALCLVLFVVPGLVGKQFVHLSEEFGLPVALRFDSLSRFTFTLSHATFSIDMIGLTLVLLVPLFIVAALMVLVGAPLQLGIWTSGELRDQERSQYKSASVVQRITGGNINLSYSQFTDQTQEWIPEGTRTTYEYKALAPFYRLYNEVLNSTSNLCSFLVNQIELEPVRFSVVAAAVMALAALALIAG